MKTLTSVVAAGAIALSALAATSTAADAGKWKRGLKHGGPPHHGHVHKHGNPAGALFAGAALGFAVGSLLAPPYYGPPPPYVVYGPPPPPPPPYPMYAYTPHQQWCINTWNTYNVATNMYYSRPGVLSVCVSPYPAY